MTDWDRLLREIIFKDEVRQIHYLLNEGADLDAAIPIHQLGTVFEKCSDEVAKYLSYYIPSKEDNATELSAVIQELYCGIFDKRVYAKRHAIGYTSDKMLGWSVGLMEREVLSKQFLESLNTICDIAPWEDRFMNVDLDSTKEVIVTSLQYLGHHKAHPTQLDELPMIEVLSPNISHIFKIRRMYRHDLEYNLGLQAWGGKEQLLGVSPVDEHSLFKREDKRIDFRIYDRMKDEVTRVRVAK